MANGNDNRPYDDDEELQQRIRPVRQVEQRTPQPPEETGYTAAQIPPMPERIPPVPAYGSSAQKADEARQLHEKIYEQPAFRDLDWKHKLGRIGAIAGNVAGEVVIPGVMPTIPGTTVNRMMRMRRLEEEIPVAQREETAAEEAKQLAPMRQWTAKHLQAETEAMANWELVPGDHLKTITDPDGTEHRQRLYQTKNGQRTAWFDEVPGPAGTAEATRIPAVGGATPAAAEARGVAAAAGSLPAVQPPAAAAAPVPAAPKQTPKVTYGEPKQLTADQQEEQNFFQAYSDLNAGKTLTPDQQANIARNEGRWGHLISANPGELRNGNDYLQTRYNVAKSILGREAPRPPQLVPGESRQLIQDKMSNYDKQLTADLDRKQREIDAQPYKDLQTQQKQLMVQKMREEMDQEAAVGVSNYLAQENYKDAMDRWIKSPHYMKDVGLITDMANRARTELPRSPGLASAATELGGAAAGSMLGGPAGAVAGLAVGAAVNLFQNAIAGPANGYLDALKRSQISQEGYDAAQAYFNALPGRMAYEITTQGMKASTLRSQELLQKVMQTVPPPDTKADAFDNAFEMYYRPMKVLTDNKYKNREGFVPPTKQQLYPPRMEGGPAVTAPPPGVKPRSYKELH